MPQPKSARRVALASEYEKTLAHWLKTDIEKRMHDVAVTGVSPDKYMESLGVIRALRQVLDKLPDFREVLD